MVRCTGTSLGAGGQMLRVPEVLTIIAKTRDRAAQERSISRSAAQGYRQEIFLLISLIQ